MSHAKAPQFVSARTDFTLPFSNPSNSQLLLALMAFTLFDQTATLLKMADTSGITKESNIPSLFSKIHENKVPSGGCGCLRFEGDPISLRSSVRMFSIVYSRRQCERSAKCRGSTYAPQLQTRVRIAWSHSGL